MYPEANAGERLIVQKQGDWEGFRAAIAGMAATPGTNGVMALTCDSLGAAPDDFDDFLRGLPVPVFGGVFPGLIANADRLDHGNIVLGLRVAIDVYVVPSLSDTSLDYDEFLARSVPPDTLAEAGTMVVFVDGLAPRVGALIDALFNAFGLQGNFIGGGAGSLKAPGLGCLITPQGILRDAAVLAIPRMASHVSAAHGWLPIAGPFEVTRAENNVILGLDWEVALDVYRRALEIPGDAFLDADGFLSIANSHPFGIVRLGGEFVVRDPVLLRADGGMVCVGDVPPGSLVHVMRGSPKSLLDAAASVRAEADSGAPPGARGALDLVMDCVSRVPFLGDGICTEVQSLVHRERPLIGAFTLGEIANDGLSTLEFHNRTVAIATLWDDIKAGGSGR